MFLKEIMKKKIINYERELKGPDSYEHFNNISKVCQYRYLRLIKLQIIFLSIIAFISTIPKVVHLYEIIKLVVLLVLIILVLILMIIQYKENYMAGWQKARFLGESVISECWLLVFKYAYYNLDDYTKALSIFHSRIKEMKREVNIKDFLCFAKVTHNDNDNPDWMRGYFDKDIKLKKDYYVKYRIEDQIKWYTNKASYNTRKSNLFFGFGLLCMSIGIILTILVLANLIPNLSYLGLFTTMSASIFSWKQTKRFEELKTTYSVATDELSDFKKAILNTGSENDLKNVIFNTEKAISREHKIWFSMRLV